MGSANATNALKRVIAMRGPAVCENASLAEALLRDYCPDDRPGVHCLMSALRERVPQSILSAAPSANREALRGILRERLQNACHMEEGSADWTVAAWMAALDNGKQPEAGIAAPPSPLDGLGGRPERANPPLPPVQDTQVSMQPEAKLPHRSPILIDGLSPLEYAKKKLVEGIDKKTVAARIRSTCKLSEKEAAALTEQAAVLVASKIPPTRSPGPEQPPQKDKKSRKNEVLGWVIFAPIGALMLLGFFWLRDYLLGVANNGIALLQGGHYAAGIMVLAIIVGIWLFIYKIFNS